MNLILEQHTGFAIGAAYEVPQIMLRASIQYNSEIKHKNAKETETLAGTAILQHQMTWLLQAHDN